MNRPVRLTLLALVIMLIASCATQSQTQSLNATLLNYEKVVRWSEWDGALDFLAPEYLEENPVSALELSRLRLFRITQYHVRSMNPSNDGLSLSQTVEIRLFNRNRAVEQVMTDQQEWHFDEERKRWYLHSGLPDVTKSR